MSAFLHDPRRNARHRVGTPDPVDRRSRKSDGVELVATLAPHPAAMGLTDAARRQDQVLVDEMSSRRRCLTQFPHRESNDSDWEIGLQMFPSHVARENELVYVKNIWFSVYKVFKSFTAVIASKE
jgi:hypothetical protein